MNNSFLSVPLEEVLTERLEVPSEEAIANGEIPLIAKIIFNSGNIQLRSDGQTKTGMILIRPGDLVVSGINAAKGAIALYGDENTKPIAATIHYCAYIPNKNRVDSSYLWRLLRSHLFRDLLIEHVPGGIKTELKAKRLLPIPIPLPSLEEQQRIVARIEELAAKIEEARGLRNQLREDFSTLCRSILADASDGAPTPTLMRELVSLKESDITVSPEEIYWFAGIYSFGRGIFQGQHKVGSEFAYTRLTRLQTGNFVYPKLMAWEGAFAVVSPECDGLVVSPEFPVFEIDQQRVLPETLEVYFHMPSVWTDVSGASTGTNVRRRRLNPANFLEFEMPLPPMKTQKRLREVKAKLDQISQLQSESSAELDALLPSILDKAFKGEL